MTVNFGPQKVTSRHLEIDFFTSGSQCEASEVHFLTLGGRKFCAIVDKFSPLKVSFRGS